MILGLYRLAIPAGPGFDINTYTENFNRIVGFTTVKQSSVVTTDWETIPWDTIPATPLSTFSLVPLTTWVLIEINIDELTGTQDWTDGLVRLEELTPASPAAPITIDLIVSRDFIDRDFALDLTGLDINDVQLLSPNGLPMTPTAASNAENTNQECISYEVRQNGPEVENWNTFTKVWDPVTVLSDLNAADKKVLHILLDKSLSGPTTSRTYQLYLDLTNVSDARYENHRSNRDYPNLLAGDARKYNGIDQYDFYELPVASEGDYQVISSVIAFDPTTPFPSINGLQTYRRVTTGDLYYYPQFYLSGNIPSFGFRRDVSVGQYIWIPDGTQLPYTGKSSQYQQSWPGSYNHFLVTFQGIDFAQTYTDAELESLVTFYVNGLQVPAIMLGSNPSPTPGYQTPPLAQLELGRGTGSSAGFQNFFAHKMRRAEWAIPSTQLNDKQIRQACNQKSLVNIVPPSEFIHNVDTTVSGTITDEVSGFAFVNNGGLQQEDFWV